MKGSRSFGSIHIKIGGCEAEEVPHDAQVDGIGQDRRAFDADAQWRNIRADADAREPFPALFTFPRSMVFFATHEWRRIGRWLGIGICRIRPVRLRGVGRRLL